MQEGISLVKHQKFKWLSEGRLGRKFGARISGLIFGENLWEFYGKG